MERHDPLHLLPPGSITDEHLRKNLLLNQFIIPQVLGGATPFHLSRCFASQFDRVQVFSVGLGLVLVPVVVVVFASVGKTSRETEVTYLHRTVWSH